MRYILFNDENSNKISYWMRNRFLDTDSSSNLKEEQWHHSDSGYEPFHYYP